MPTIPSTVSSSATASGLLKRTSQVALGATLDLTVDMGLPIATAVLSSSLIDSYGRKVLDLAVTPEIPALASCTVAKLTGATGALRPGRYSYEVKATIGASTIFSGLYELHVLQPLVTANSAPPAPSAGNSLTVGPYPALSAVGALRCVMLTAGALEICDGADAASFGRMVGLAPVSASPGDLLAPVRSGLVTDGSWSWATSIPVYVGAGGLLTQDLTGLAYIQIAGYPASATSVYMDVEDAVRL